MEIMEFWDVVDLIVPLSLDESLDDDKTVIVDVEVFVLEVLNGAFVGEDTVVSRPVALEVGFGGEYFRLNHHLKLNFLKSI